MKSKTRLDSAVFHLTPTRTRCDLFIIANEKKEKIASGLLNPFLAHLKVAQDQIAQGGYSILLEPNPDSDATWFTKGTVERFVRFVSTPEILERVYTIESEILQIEKAIAIQGNNDVGVDFHQAKPAASSEGNKIVSDGNEKAIVLYKPGENSSEANGSSANEGNSKLQLLKVLETRKTMLQKEQCMAFARAVAAGFDIDHMEPLVSFAECFGALRLMGACFRFTDLWKAKHESGQWLEIEAAEAMPGKSDFSAMNASGIVLSGMANKQHESHCELESESTEKAGIDTNADEKRPTDHQIPVGQQEYFPGQFPHPMFPPWPMHSSPRGVPVYQAYPMPGMPYYPNYPGNGPFYPPSYPPGEDSRFNVGHKTGQKRQSMDGRDSDSESETLETDASKIRSQRDLVLENEASHGLERGRKKAGKSGKKQSGLVVIRNINYITPQKQDWSGDESESASDSGTDNETGDLQADAPTMTHKNSLKSSKRKGNQRKSADEGNFHAKEESLYGKETDGGHWQAFQNYLLRGADEDDCSANEGMFAMERSAQTKRRQNTMGDDPLALGERDPVGVRDTRINEFHKVNGNVSRIPRSSHDNVLISREEGNYASGRGHEDDIHYTERNGRKIVYRSASDDFMIGGHGQSNMRSSLDPLAGNGLEGVITLDRRASHDMADETYIVPFRSMSLDQAGIGDRPTIDMNSEMPMRCKSSERTDSQDNYEPHDLSLMPERGSEKRSIGYDPAFDYERQFLVKDASLPNKRNKEVVTASKQGSKNADKDRRSKVGHDVSDKKAGGPIRKVNPSKANPLEDARARAEKLRSFKADLQKMKKEQEDAEHKRVEALKMERQKRIAARANSAAAQSALPTRKPLPAKPSPISHRGSKFSDTEPGSSSPLQRSKIRTTSLGSSDSKKLSKATKSSDMSHLTGNRLTRSVSSLSETKKETSGVTPDSKASMARIRRLSEPKTSSHPSTLVKTRSAEPISKPKIANGPERKKVSAIMTLDRSKAATLPELKIKASKGPSNVGQTNSAAKEIIMKVNECKPIVTSETAVLNTNNERLLHESDRDDNPVIEKTVVMLECEKPSVPAAVVSEKLIDERKAYDDNNETGEKTKAVEYTAIRAVPSPMDGVDRKTIPSQVQEHPGLYEVTTKSLGKEMPKFSSIIIAEKPYPAPHARVSTLEDPPPRNLDYDKAPPTSSNSVSAGVETAKAYVTDFNNLKLEKIPEVLEKPQVKESKGFRRLLKFGKKNHSSATGEQSIESDSGSIYGAEMDDNAVNPAAANEVHTLKNLISQDETSTASSTSQKCKCLLQ